MRTVNIQTHFHVETLLRAAHARSWPDSRIVHLAQTVTVSRKKEGNHQIESIFVSKNGGS